MRSLFSCSAVPAAERQRAESSRPFYQGRRNLSAKTLHLRFDDPCNGKCRTELIEDEELREQIKGSGIGTSATRAEILKKLVFIKYLALNKKTQVITPTQLGEMIYDVVHQSIRPLLNPELTASWEKGLTYVAEGSITSEEYMGKLENFVTRHTVNVKQLRNQFQLKSSFDASAPYYRKASSTRSRTGKRTAAEDSSAKSYSTARKKGAQNS